MSTPRAGTGKAPAEMSPRNTPKRQENWRPQRDSNPCYGLERAES